MNQKAGQPDDALKITAGRRTVINQLDMGVADKSAQAHAANWLRDLAKHYDLPATYLTKDTCYRDLMSGNCTDANGQKAALDWIYALLAEKPHYNEGIEMDDERTSANERQPGGDHYQKRKIQHWDFAVSNGYRYLTGQITKYVFRWKDKGGVLDLEKAEHFLQKLFETRLDEDTQVDLMEFLVENDITGDEALVITMIHAFHQSDNPAYLQIAGQALARLRKSAAANA